jgi:hypothetical protein
MTERLLQYIWQYQYFNKTELVTEGRVSQEVYVIAPGIYNTNQGPDFSEARIRIGEEVWAGNVELHVKASDWERHKHEFDSNYQSVVLHVVWQNDLKSETYFPPMMSLESRVPGHLLQQYEEWMMSPSFIPCGNRLSTVDELVWIKWKEWLMVERLEQKKSVLYQYLEESNNHWEEVLWWSLAANFGATVNRESFGLLARSLPLKLLAKHKSQIHQLEALLFGQAGLLSGKFLESYPVMLKKEYTFLKRKYSLKPIFAPIHFLRMRPVNFPTVRLAQLAALFHVTEHLFSSLIEVDKLTDLRKLFNITANDYWHYHFRFEETTAYSPKHLGAQMIDNIIINTVVPLVYAYGRHHKNDILTDKVFHWLDITGAEKNRITSRFYACGIHCSNAFDTQALYQLKSHYCDHKRCLECAAGNAILKRPS